MVFAVGSSHASDEFEVTATGGLRVLVVAAFQVNVKTANPVLPRMSREGDLLWDLPRLMNLKSVYLAAGQGAIAHIMSKITCHLGLARRRSGMIWIAGSLDWSHTRLLGVLVDGCDSTN